MKAFLIAILSFSLSITVFGQKLPDSVVQKNINNIIHKPPLGSINDLENIFTLAEKQELDSIIKSIEGEAKTEIVFLSLDSLPVKELSFDSTTIVLANTWCIGKGYNHRGILIAISKHLRKIRIQNSFEIEKILSDAETEEIIGESIIPQFKKDNYFIGIEEGIIALGKKVNSN